MAFTFGLGGSVVLGSQLILRNAVEINQKLLRLACHRPERRFGLVSATELRRSRAESKVHANIIPFPYRGGRNISLFRACMCRDDRASYFLQRNQMHCLARPDLGNPQEFGLLATRIKTEPFSEADAPPMAA